MKNKKWFDILAIPIAEFITSTLFVILVMISFMIGIVWHLNVVFESWFLAIGFQCVVLIASVNFEILPKIIISSSYEKGEYKQKTLPAIAVYMSIFMFWFVSISFGAIDSIKNSEWLALAIALTKAFTMSAMELMFSYLFNSRWKQDLERLNYKTPQPNTREALKRDTIENNDSKSSNYV